MSENTQLTLATGYDTDRMIFSEPQFGTIPNSVPQINYKRITIATRNPNGTVGDFILPTSRVFSFGVSENTNPETGKVNGYVMPLCLYNRDGPSQDEKDWVETFNNIVEKCKDHLVENRETIEMYDLEKRDLKKLNPLYYRKEKGKVIPGTGPTLYAKLIVSKKQNKIISMFYDGNGESVDPLALLGKYCYATSAIKIESIFIGNKISLQIKLYECEVKLVETGMRRLMRPKAQKRVLLAKSSHPLNDMKSSPQKLDEIDEIPNSDSESEKEFDEIPNSDSESEKESVKPLPPKRPKSKRRVKKVIRKRND